MLPPVLLDCAMTSAESAAAKMARRTPFQGWLAKFILSRPQREFDRAGCFRYLIREQAKSHLQVAHDSSAATGTPDLNPLHGLVTRLLDEQLTTVPDLPATPPEVASTTAAPATTTPVAKRANAKVGVVQLRFTLRQDQDVVER
jgi:hypothetical protein